MGFAQRRNRETAVIANVLCDLSSSVRNHRRGENVQQILAVAALRLDSRDLRAYRPHTIPAESALTVWATCSELRFRSHGIFCPSYSPARLQTASPRHSQGPL